MNREGSFNIHSTHICHLLFAELTPHPPTDVKVKQADDYIVVSWHPAKDSPVPVHHYQVYYRTVGQWVPLSGQLQTNHAWFLWAVWSYGISYHFKVYSFSDTATQSEPSDVVSLSAHGKKLSKNMSTFP